MQHESRDPYGSDLRHRRIARPALRQLPRPTPSRREQPLVPFDLLGLAHRYAGDLRMRRIQYHVALYRKEDRRNDQRDGLPGNQPLLAERLTDLVVGRIPSLGEFVCLVRLYSQSRRNRNGDRHLMTRNAGGAELRQLFQHRSAVRRAGIDCGPAPGIPSPADPAGVLPGKQRKTTVGDSIADQLPPKLPLRPVSHAGYSSAPVPPSSRPTPRKQDRGADAARATGAG